MSTLRVIWYSIVNGANDYWSIFTLKSWAFGWLIRVVSQVTFFALIGKLLRSDVQTDFLLLGHTHLPLQQRLGNLTVVNPGSVGLPRDSGGKANYAVYEQGGSPSNR